MKLMIQCVVYLTLTKDIALNVKYPHQFCARNKKFLLKSSECGCFYCVKIFNPNLIEEWIDGEESALCPFCGINSVIPEHENYELNEKLLIQMRKYRFK
jgi:hypothetical protein